jgi:hypothetical protein
MLLEFVSDIRRQTLEFLKVLILPSDLKLVAAFGRTC